MGWLTVSEGPGDDRVDVELEEEPPVGPYFVGRHLAGGGWRWYENGKLHGASFKHREACEGAQGRI